MFSYQKNWRMQIGWHKKTVSEDMKIYVNKSRQAEERTERERDAA